MTAIFDWLREALDYLLGWLPELWQDLLEIAVAKLTLALVGFTHWALETAWAASVIILEDLQLSDYIADAMSGLDARTAAYLAFFRIPECINQVAAFAATRFSLRVIPFV